MVLAYVLNQIDRRRTPVRQAYKMLCDRAERTQRSQRTARCRSDIVEHRYAADGLRPRGWRTPLRSESLVQAASWKMTPSVYRSPDRSLLTPWRSVTR